MSRLNGPTRTNRPAKLIDVARHAGVSTGTVSNVLNHPDKVKEGTSARVMRSIEHLGFVRDTNASSLANGGSHDIGLVVIDLANSIFLDAARGAQSTARAAGLNLLMAGSENDFEVQSSNVDSFIGARVAGLLLAPMQDSTAQIQRLTKRHVPVVLVNYDPGTDHACSVVVDNDEAGYIAARHLIDLGRRRLAFVTVDWDLQPVEQRRHGISRAVAESGGSVTLEEIVADDLEVGSGNAIARQIAARPAAERPDAVVAVTDNLAVGFIEQAAELGIDVPGDIAVMGTDDNTSAARCRMTLSTVTMQGRQLGAAAMDLLMDEIRHGRDEHRHQRVVLTPQLVVQQSTVR